MHMQQPCVHVSTDYRLGISVCQLKMYGGYVHLADVAYRADLCNIQTASGRAHEIVYPGNLEEVALRCSKAANLKQLALLQP